MKNLDYIKPDWPAPPSVCAYTTVRSTWGGRHPCQEANAANKAEKHEEYKQQANLSLKTLLSLPANPITWLKQTHSNIAIDIAKAKQGHPADAAFTSRPHQVCAVLTADCLPLLLCDQQGTCVAAVHAGWRGLASGIIENTVAALGKPGEALMAWLGPAIGPLQFEVGEDVYEAFTKDRPAFASAFMKRDTQHAETRKWLANLYELARLRLQELGVTQVYGGQYCTFTQEDLFFSYRRDQGETGRMASLIWIEP